MSCRRDRCYRIEVFRKYRCNDPAWRKQSILRIRNWITFRCHHLNRFRDAERYYSTLAHELTHWTKHEQRLNRDFGRTRWGDAGYACEELVAELGSAFLGADLELHQEPREDNAAYIANWLEVLKNDNRAIFSASAYAQRAADYLQQKAAAQVLQTCAA
jgi:antirestriction protein ArdC